MAATGEVIVPQTPEPTLAAATTVAAAAPTPAPAVVAMVPTAVEPAATITSSSYIGNTVSKVPLLGGYVAPVLESRVLKPVTNFADPYVQSGVDIATPYVAGAVQKAQPYVEGAVQRAQPYVEGAVQRAQPLVDRALPSVQALPGQISAVPGQVVETVKATPARVYNTTVNAATSAVQTVAAVPGQVYQGTVNTVCSTLQTVKALPGQVKSGVAYTTDSIVSAPGRAYQTVLDRGAPIVTSAALLAQPYVHTGVGIITPYVESTLTNQRVQNMYQSRVVQGSIEKATPYVEPVLTHPRVKAVADPVIEWARPRSLTQ
jgi:hypothetical protein